MMNRGCNSSIKQIKSSLNLWLVRILFDGVSIFVYLLLRNY